MLVCINAEGTGTFAANTHSFGRGLKTRTRTKISLNKLEIQNILCFNFKMLYNSVLLVKLLREANFFAWMPIPCLAIP